MSSKRAIVVIVLFIIVFSNISFSKVRLDAWRTHSSMNNIRSMTIDWLGRYWGATSGGLFAWDEAKDTTLEFRNIDALLHIDMSAIICDIPNKRIYAGTENGTLEIMDENYNFTHILDIKNSGFSNPIIKQIILYNGLVYVAGGFGLTVFDPVRQVFIEDALNLGEFPRNTQVNQMIIFSGQIWLATDNGVAYADITKPLAPRDAWKNYSREDGIPDKRVFDIAGWNNDIYIATEKNISRLDDTVFTPIREEYAVGLEAKGNDLFYATPWYIKGIGSGLIEASYPWLLSNFVSFNPDSSGDFVLFFLNNSFGLMSNSNISHIKSNTPLSNQFRSLKILPLESPPESGNTLWACTDGSSVGNGFMSYSDGQWHNYRPETFGDSANMVRSSYLINPHPDGSVYLSSWGSGLLIYHPGDSDTSGTIEIFDENNAPFISENGFIVVGQTGIDKNGKVWLPQYGKLSNGPNLLSYIVDNGFDAFTNRVSPSQRTYHVLEIDNWGTKWLGSLPQDASGIYYFNDNNTPDITSDDIYGTVTTSNTSLIDNDITCIVKDQSGMLWVGTPSGLSVIINPSNVLNGDLPAVRKEIRDLRNMYIKDISVDVLNNKWVATPEGVYVLDPDGYAMDILTINNSPLLSNNVLSIANDPATGRVFFGTAMGLSEAWSLSVAPESEYSISCYPQPFDPSKDGELVIDGLAENSEIKIVTIDGNLVRSISVSGSKAVWDGLDSFGNKTGSGVFLVLATSATLGNTGIAKIAVINK
jgi:hypothetical protein